MQTFAQKAFRFYRSLETPVKLPRGVGVMNPYTSPQVVAYVRAFLEKSFSDTTNGVFVFGINPGRFRAGLTGVTFTDPVALEQNCKIANALEKRRELSSDFIYRFIEHWGGARKFYRRFFLTAISPLGFTRGGINYNYYDDARLLEASRPFVIKPLRKQLALGTRRDTAIVLGTGKNKKAFAALNAEQRFFDGVRYLDHPRFIMQYRRKRIAEYVAQYRRTSSEARAGL